MIWTCDACGRDFRKLGRSWTCPYCGFNTNPRDPMHRSRQWLEQMAQRLREEQDDDGSERDRDELHDRDSD